jgi:zinc transporter 2
MHDHEPEIAEPVHERHHNINVRAAFIHVLGDALQTIGVMIAAALIWHDPSWKIADPICTFMFSILVLFTTIRLVKQSVGVLMEGIPEGIDPKAVENSLFDVEGVREVHDLHIWSLSVGKPSLSVHLLAEGDGKGVLERSTKMLAREYNIHHTTIQVELAHDEVACNPHFQ